MPIEGEDLLTDLLAAGNYFGTDNWQPNQTAGLKMIGCRCFNIPKGAMSRYYSPPARYTEISRRFPFLPPDSGQSRVLLGRKNSLQKPGLDHSIDHARNRPRSWRGCGRDQLGWSWVATYLSQISAGTLGYNYNVAGHCNIFGPSAHGAINGDTARSTGHRTLSAIAIALLAMLIGAVQLVFGAGVAYAALDNQETLTDNLGDILTIQQWDTLINITPPLDRNSHTVEWFHSGRVVYTVTGPNASQFAGTLELGYQVSFSSALNSGLRFKYQSFNLREFGGHSFEFTLSPDFLPGVSFSSNLGNGPGNQEVAMFAVPVAGPSGSVRISNAHDTLTGAEGGVVLRPYARLSGKDNGGGTVISTYGDAWNAD